MYEIRVYNNTSIRIHDEFLQNAIKEICENKVNALIVDLESESDFVFVNVPDLGVRKYAHAWESYHPHAVQEFDEIGDADAAYPQILSMFNCRDAALAPVPSVLDDWEGYREWMQWLLRS